MIKINDKICINKAKQALAHARKLAETNPSKLDKMTKAQVMDQLRKTRQKLWNEKIKSRSRYK